MRSAVVMLLALTVVLRGQEPPVTVVMSRATQYVRVFMERFSSVVAEERYVQDIIAAAVVRPRHRESVADFLLVKPDAASDSLAFRDVFEVDQMPVRDRDERLTRLFLESPSTALAQAEAINRESARHNIGTERTVNNPLLPLAFLQDRYRPHFSYSLDKPERIDEMEVSVVAFQEGERPTLIRGTAGRDLPARGRYWIDDEGQILKAEISTSDNVLRSKITVTFRFDARFRVCVPTLMEEEYSLVNNRQTTKGVARYDRFREFEIKTTEKPEVGR